jgi:ParB family transcriptional regulator, chromosome partitioning protein
VSAKLAALSINQEAEVSMHTTATKRKTTKKSPIVDSEGEQSLMKALGTHEQLQSEGNNLEKLTQSNKIVDIALSDIRPHSSNRDLSTDESIDQLAESIEELGQLEPATVRDIGAVGASGYRYELVSGERRFRALQKLDRPTIRAVVILETRSEGLVRLAAANSQRKDLNAIERAELIVMLMKPVADGGSGLSREAAGKAVGLNSESGTKNALRMLKLPESIKKLVRSGELSERASRKLIPFADHPTIAKEIERNLADEESRVELAAMENWPYWLESIVEGCTRPMDKEQRSASDLVKGCWNRYPMLFEPTDEQLAALAPFDLQDGKETLRVTANTKLWDSLQKPLVEERFNNDRSGSKKKTTTRSVSEGSTKKLTPAQEKAEAARKAKEAKERIERFTILWVGYALRCQLAEQAREEQRYATLGFLVQSLHTKHDLNQAIDAAYAESNVKLSNVGKKYSGSAQDVPEQNEYCWIEDWWSNMLWPSLPGGLPEVEKLPGMSADAIRALATRCKVTMRHFWKAAAIDDSDQRRLLSMWLGRHTTEQLKAMCDTMGKLTTLHKRSDLVEFLLGHHEPAKLLPIPKELDK